ncbi:MAG: PD-(D/E)XK nuclease family protein [Oscillospiraceae bacterium]|nr:PD-(D/E)XK nuclease family protein [Oscillospiraceae bacterium]
MLNLILGIGGTGRTTAVMENIKKRAEEKKQCVLLVPEQFSSSAESLCYTVLGDEGSAYVEVTSFRTLAQRLEAFYGGVTVKTITDAGRVVYVRRALNTLADGLKHYRKHRRNTAFCQMCADTVKELKTAGATGTQLAQIASNIGEEGDKLAELALIFAAYEAAIDGTVMDETDKITRAAEKADARYFCEKAFYIDDFDGFTAPEYRMLARIIENAQSCTVTLCCDSLQDYDDGMGIFSPVKKTASRLIRLAKRAEVAVAAPQILNQIKRTQRKGLVAVNHFLAFGSVKEQGCADGVFVRSAANVYAEAKYVAAKIKMLGAAGEKYSDMAIICRQSDTYAAALRYELKLMDIPYFMDEATTVEHVAPAAFIRAALLIAKNGLATEPILTLLKTGLCGADENSLTALENYAFTWQPSGADWKAVFEKNPAGFKPAFTEEDTRQLQYAEALRDKMIPPLQAFAESCKQTNAAQLSRSLFLLLEHFGAMEHLTATAQKIANEGQILLAEDMLRTWDITMDLLDEMAGLLGQEAITAGEYDELFLLLLRTTEVGHAPQTLDGVIITTANRMRLDAPRYAFVVGVNEGVFPKQIGYSGLLNHTDREKLVENGVEMPGSFENRILLEQMFFYRALTAPSQGLYISYSTTQGGSAKQPSAALVELAELLKATEEPLPYAAYAATPAAAADILSENWRNPSSQTAAITQVLEQLQQSDALSVMRAAAAQPPFAVTDTGALKQIITEEMQISPSKMERYYSCRFSYFLEYVLKVKPRRKAELSPIETGSFVHYILEQVIRRCADTFCDLTKAELQQLAEEIADDYIAENMAGATGRRFAYIISRLKKGTARLLCYIQDEQKQSSFHPVAFEQEIGGAGVPPLTFETSNQEHVKVVGFIDRVDLMEREGKSYIRVMDYKTGNKAFELEDVYCGLNTQMLLYLFTLRQNSTQYKQPVPSGVLYLVSDPPPRHGERNEGADSAAKPIYTVDGLVLNDPLVINAMDKGETGFYVPFAFNAKGGAKTSKKLADMEKLGRIEKHVQQLVIDMATQLYAGHIAAVPLLNKSKHSPCDYCDYKCICRHECGVNESAVSAPDKFFEAEEATV